MKNKKYLFKLKYLIKLLLKWTAKKILNKPSIKTFVLRILAKYPKFKHRLRLLTLEAQMPSKPNKLDEMSLNFASPNATYIYQELKKVIEARKSSCES